MITVSEVSTRFVEGYARLDPGHAARMMGMGVNGSQLRDYSPQGNQALVEFLHQIRHALDTAAVINEAERLGRIYLNRWISGQLAVIDAGEPERDVSILAGPPAMVRLGFDLVAPASSEEWEAVTERLEGVPAAMAGYRQSLEAGLSSGVVASRRCVEALAEQCEVWAGVSGPGWFSQFAGSKSDAPVADRLALAGRAADAAYGQLSAWLRERYLPAATEEDGVGEERYKLWALYFLGAELDVEEAYAWGWEELARLEAEQAGEVERIRAGADFAEIRQLLNHDPNHCIAGVEPWRDWLQELTDRTISEMEGRHFDIDPRLRRCVVSIPPEGAAAAPYYTPPSDDLVHPGRIWFPSQGRTSFPTWDAVTTVFHEAVPGHHLQLGATRLVELTRAQRLGFSSAHGEGWALYAERLMDELGRFERPEFRLGFLSMQAFRAARVVVDIGLHTGRPIPAGRPGAGTRWHYDMAVDYLESASGRDAGFCRSEALRYLAWPTQATCYKLGERVWLEGRRLAQRAQGPCFDLKAWHGRALALGPLGLDDFSAELARLAGAEEA